MNASEKDLELDIDFQYIIENKKFKIAKQVRKTLFVSFAILLLLLLLFALNLVMKSGLYQLIIVSDLFLVVLFSFYTIRFLKQLKFKEIVNNNSGEDITSKILYFLEINNIDYVFGPDNKIITFKGRKLYSSGSTHEYVIILIEENSLFINNIIQGSLLINTGWEYPYKKQYAELKQKLKHVLGS